MKNLSAKIKISVCAAVCLCVLVAFACMAFCAREEKSGEANDREVIDIWQIDSFEGGRGSRAEFLQSVGNAYAKGGGSYVNVTALSSEAARLNLANGNSPDIISYGTGVYGLEGYIVNYVEWCRGGYCLLTVDGDFSDASASNTVANAGRENLTSAALLLCGLNGAEALPPTGAYLRLIDGSSKYLFGTQRDIYRLKTRGVAFKVKPVTEFNDLYQNISITSSCKVAEAAKGYIEFLLGRSSEITRLGLISGASVYEDEMRAMTDITFEYKLSSPVSEDTYKRLENLISSGDINMLKSFFK